MPVRRLEFPDKKHVSIIFPDIGRDTVRFIFSFNGGLKVLAWMKIGYDGSLYLNSRLPESKIVHKANAVADGKGGFRNLSAPEDISLDTISKDNRKSSCHSSGKVKSYGAFEESAKLADLTKPTLIRQDQYTKPHRFMSIEQNELRPQASLCQGSAINHLI